MNADACLFCCTHGGMSAIAYDNTKAYILDGSWFLLQIKHFDSLAVHSFHLWRSFCLDPVLLYQWFTRGPNWLYRKSYLCSRGDANVFAFRFTLRSCGTKFGLHRALHLTCIFWVMLSMALMFRSVNVYLVGRLFFYVLSDHISPSSQQWVGSTLGFPC